MKTRWSIKLVILVTWVWSWASVLPTPLNPWNFLEPSNFYVLDCNVQLDVCRFFTFCKSSNLFIESKRSAKHKISEQQKEINLPIYLFNTISHMLQLVFPASFSPSSVSRACQFCEAFPNRHNILTWKWWTKLKIIKSFQGSVRFQPCQSIRFLSRLLTGVISYMWS